MTLAADTSPAPGAARSPRAGAQTVSVLALGCKANQEEMECLLSRLGEAGFRVVPFGEAADWVVVNTCTVTAAGDSDSRQMIRRAARSKGAGRLVVTGCLAQRDPRTPAAIPGVDWILGNREKQHLAGWIRGGEWAAAAGTEARIPSPQIRVGTDPTLDGFAEYGGARDGRRTRASLKVQDGCDEPCTFCVIPQVRGRSRSRKLDDVVRQARLLGRSRYREINLTGINTALWGRDLPGRPELPDLLDALQPIEEVERVRLNSLEPQHLAPEWIERMAACEKLCPHFHLPLQSGDAAVLRRMNRRYTPALYARLVRAIHRQRGDAAIGCDVLVGFPGETEEQFENTYRFVADLPLAYLHVFAYSPRPHTAALGLGPAVEPAIRKERSARLRFLDQDLRRRFASEQRHTVQAVLPETPAGPGHWQGLTGNYLRVRFPWSPASEERGALPLVLLESPGEDGMHQARTLGRGWTAGRSEPRDPRRDRGAAEGPP